MTKVAAFSWGPTALRTVVIIKEQAGRQFWSEPGHLAKTFFKWILSFTLHQGWTTRVRVSTLIGLELHF